MILSNRIQETYRQVISKLHVWGLPIFIIGGFSTSFLLHLASTDSYFNRLELATLHRLAGFFLILSLFVLIYDWLYYYFIPQERARLTLKPRELLQRQRKLPFRKQVNNWFYITLIFLCFTGLLNYLSLDLQLSLFFSPAILKVWHQYIAWAFLSLLLVRYYYIGRVWAGYIADALRKT